MKREPNLKELYEIMQQWHVGVMTDFEAESWAHAALSIAYPPSSDTIFVGAICGTPEAWEQLKAEAEKRQRTAKYFIVPNDLEE